MVARTGRTPHRRSTSLAARMRDDQRRRPPPHQVGHAFSRGATSRPARPTAARRVSGGQQATVSAGSSTIRDFDTRLCRQSSDLSGKLGGTGRHRQSSKSSKGLISRASAHPQRRRHRPGGHVLRPAGRYRADQRRPGYANFAIAEPPLKLVLLENAGQGGSLDHLGVEVPDTDTVEAEQARLAETGLASSVEGETTCCYTRQDKFWVQARPTAGPGSSAPCSPTVRPSTPKVTGPVLRRHQPPGDTPCPTTRPAVAGASAATPGGMRKERTVTSDIEVVLIGADRPA